MLKHSIKTKAILLILAIQTLIILNVDGQAYYYDELKEGGALLVLGRG